LVVGAHVGKLDKKNPKRVTRLGLSSLPQLRLLVTGGGLSGDWAPPGRPDAVGKNSDRLQQSYSGILWKLLAVAKVDHDGFAAEEQPADP
jgi:hypothetical protein